MDFCKECLRNNSNFCDCCTRHLGKMPTNYIHKDAVTIPIKPITHKLPEKEESLPSYGKYELIGKSIGSLVDEKNQAYGDSFNKSGEFLKILYPDGIQPEQYGDMLGIVRVFDKLMRIATNKGAFNENPWTDICGYSILKSEEKCS